jgi:hypothetical protein
LFDMAADDAVAFERPLPETSDVPVRERLRWEKELLGLYLSEHPMGEVAEQVGRFVNAFSSDLRDESLDGQRVVVGGIVTGVRMVVTKAKASMAIVTIEDLQGGIEIVVFPRLYEQTAPTWVEGRILLIAGRIDHKGEEISLLADLVADWDDAVAKGPDSFAREVAAGDRGGRRRQAGGGSNGNGQGVRPPPVGIPLEAGVAVGAAAGAPRPPMVSPLRGDGESAAHPAPLPPIAPPEPVPTYLDAAASGPLAGDRDAEPAVPDEARHRIVDSVVVSAPVDARADAVLHVRFARYAAPDRLVGAMEAFKALLRDRPGETRVVIHVPGPSGGEPRPMELRRGVAYDAELLAEVRRRLGEGVVELQLA